MKICPTCQATYTQDAMECPRDHTPLQASDVWPEGTIVEGKYRILGIIGQDLACTVYKAVRLRAEQPRALKVLNKSLADKPDFVEVFKLEARERKKLRHANVARVESIETSDGRPFIVMEYAQGRTLKGIIEHEAPLPPRRACGLARQIAAGLGAAHAMRILHRDLKPESVFVTSGKKSEVVKLLGFGTSQLKEILVGDHFRTSPEAVIGTFQYLSPEQALGKFGEEMDGRADLYSLGVILYQMLSGHLPFKATEAADWMTAHILQTPTMIGSAYPDLAIPDALSKLVAKCMEKNPALRPASAKKLIREIEQVEKGLAQSGGTGHGWKFWLF